MALLAALILGSLIGLTLGALGGGGSVLTVPILIYGLRIPPVQATAMSQVVVGISSIAASLVHARAGNLKLDVVLAMMLLGVFGAGFGRGLSKVVDPVVIVAVLAIVMVTSASLLIRRSLQSRQVEPTASDLEAPLSLSRDGNSPRDREVRPQRNGPSWWRRLPVLAVTGAAVGFLTGFLGVGGGFVIVPALVLVAGVGMKPAVGSSLMVIGLNCAASIGTDLIREGQLDIDLKLTAMFTLSALVASLIGSNLAKHARSSQQQFWFACLVMLVGLIMLGDAFLF